MLKAQAASDHARRHGSANATAAALDGDVKVRVPRRRLIRRPVLVDRLTGAKDSSLAILVAPPGYGKSTLLSEWAERDRRTFVWAGVDDYHSDDIELAVRSIIASLSEAGLIELATSSALIGLVPLGPTDVLAAAMQCVCAPHGFVLVLDDAHVLTPGVLRQIVVPVLKGLPPESLVAVSSRTEPSLPIGRLRAHRALVEIRTQDLAMAPAEAANLLKKAGIELEFEAMQGLVRETEGWPAALYLAALSLHKHPELPAGSAAFGGDDHLLSDFLRDEVLSAVPSDLREFAVRSAVLDELSGSLCDEVLEQPSSAIALAKIAQISQLLVPLDPAHERYRWQHLFRDALQAELRRTDPDSEAQLHYRASTWYARQADPDRAINHAVAAVDPDLTGSLLWVNVLSYVTRGEPARVERWLGSFSHEVIAAHPALAASAALSALAAGHLDDAQRWTVSASAALGRESGSEQPRSLATGLAALDTLMARTGAGHMREAAARAYEVEPHHSPWHPVLCLVSGVAEHLSGDRTAARALLEEGADLSGAAEPLIAALCRSVNAMMAIEQKEWELAEELTDHAVTLLEEHGLDTCPISALVFAASAAARARQGRADEAKHDVRRATELLAMLGEFISWYGAEARILLAHASLSLADAARARTLLAEASRLARRTSGAVIFEHWFDEAWAYMDTLAESILPGPSSLTIAELRILRFLPSHRSFREIGTQLGVSPNTVKTQAHAVYRKLGAASRSEAVARASEAGLIGQ
jgi:LuxR family transcriptional regulator, maltose regulon positive regulatory protein